MTNPVEPNAYAYDPDNRVWLRPHASSIAYSDGDDSENYLLSVLKNATDIRALSSELNAHIRDWPSMYHLSPIRHNLLRPFDFKPEQRILELGCGCGAMTRFLGESGATVVAVEGSRRRAQIAAERCRDLQNVSVYCDNIVDFEPGIVFDFVTLIGVLEYSPVYIHGEDPFRICLERAREYLAPGGKLIIAIENQLGLKYFAGAPEDHLGQRMYGVENSYQPNQPRTFGRKRMERILQTAGFLNVEFMVPFPDYKTPVSIITENGLGNSEFDAPALASHSVKRDHSVAEGIGFNLERVWRDVFDNGLALDLANSFLIVAAQDERRVGASGNVLAYHYSAERRRSFCKETKFVAQENGSINVISRPLVEKNLGEKQDLSEGEPYQFVLKGSDRYVLGKSMSDSFVQIVTRSGWTVQAIGLFFSDYVRTVKKLLTQDNVPCSLLDAHDLLPGRYLDAIPANLIVDEKGVVSFIDTEWQTAEPIEFGYLLFRSCLNSMLGVSAVALPENRNELVLESFMRSVFEQVGIALSHEDCRRYAELELAFQYWVTGKEHFTVEQFLAYSPTIRESMQNLIDERNQAIDERNQAVGLVESICRSKSWVLTRPLRVIALLLRGEYREVLKRPHWRVD